MTGHEAMTDERLAEIRRRAIHATEGPWVCETAENDFDCHFTVRSTAHFAEHPWSPRYVAWLNGAIRDASIEQIRQQTCPTCGYFIHNHRMLQVGADVRVDNDMRDDAEFIAHAREDIPALLAEVKRLQSWRDIAAEHLSNQIALEQENERLRNEVLALKLQADGAASLLLDVQRDCVAARQEANAMRAIVEAVAGDIVAVYWNRETHRFCCRWCDADHKLHIRQIEHTADCRYQQARAFVAQYPAQHEEQAQKGEA